MITLDQAKAMFADMVAKSAERFTIDDVWEVQYNEPIYVMTVIDAEGNQHLPGIKFPSIRKHDGAIIDCQFSCPA